jgi:hypothetical protein
MRPVSAEGGAAPETGADRAGRHVLQDNEYRIG